MNKDDPQDRAVIKEITILALSAGSSFVQDPSNKYVMVASLLSLASNSTTVDARRLLNVARRVLGITEE